MLKKSSKNSGFTLIEVLVFITLLSLLFTAVLTLSTSLLKTAKYNENKILATHFGEELYEWLQTEKELDWAGPTGFLTKAPTYVTPVSYCFNSPTLTASDWPSSGACSDSSYALGNRFNRQIELTLKDVTTPLGAVEQQVEAKIEVSWRDGSFPPFTVSITTVFNNI